MSRYESDYEELPGTNLGLELSHPALQLPLEFIPHDTEPTVDVGRHRFKDEQAKVYLSYYDDEDGDWFVWEDHWRQLPFEMMHRAFSINELAQLKFTSFFMSEVSEEFRYNPLYRVIHKVFSSLWHWGYGVKNYNHIVHWYKALSKFEFAPGFEVRLDYSTAYNEFGYSQYARRFLDGPFAYLIYHKGEHVMTIGFAVSTFGLFVPQIQLAKPKGNRWLYKLPTHYIDFVLERLAANFHNSPLLFPEGNSLAKSAKAKYPKDIRSNFTNEMFSHIEKTYNRPLSRFRRGKKESMVGISFNYLSDTTKQYLLAWEHKYMNYKPTPKLEEVA